MTWWFFLFLFIGSFETPFAPLLSILGSRVVWRRVNIGISGCALDFEDSYFDQRRIIMCFFDCVECGKTSETRTRGGFVLCGCVVHRWTEFIVAIALLVLAVSFCEATSVSERFCAFYHVQTRIWGPLGMKPQENVVFADALPKRRRSAAKTSRIWYWTQHCLSLYSTVRTWLFATKRGLFVHIKLVILLPTSMVGSLIMASTLLHCAKLLDPHCPQLCWCHHRYIVPYPHEQQQFTTM